MKDLSYVLLQVEADSRKIRAAIDPADALPMLAREREQALAILITDEQVLLNVIAEFDLHIGDRVGSC